MGKEKSRVSKITIRVDNLTAKKRKLKIDLEENCTLRDSRFSSPRRLRNLDGLNLNDPHRRQSRIYYFRPPAKVQYSRKRLLFSWQLSLRAKQKKRIEIIEQNKRI